MPVEGLPACLRLVVSTLPDYKDEGIKKGFQCYSRLRTALHDDNACFAKVEDITDPKEVVLHLLRLQGRTVTETQMEAILKAFHDRSPDDAAGTPLWLTLVAHMAAKWRSYDTPPEVDKSVRGIIIALFKRMAAQHGEVVVRKVLACITLCKDGITTVELGHVLSLDDEVLSKVFEW